MALPQQWHVYGGLGIAGSVRAPPAVLPDRAVDPPTELGAGVSLLGPPGGAERPALASVCAVSRCAAAAVAALAAVAA